jgi:hypothetical protein
MSLLSTIYLRYFRGAKGDIYATFAERKETLRYFRGAKGDNYATFAERKETLVAAQKRGVGTAARRCLTYYACFGGLLTEDRGCGQKWWANETATPP